MSRSWSKRYIFGFKGCQPYQEDPFENGVTPGCSTTCLNTDYNTSYVDDKYYGGDHYMLALPKVDQIQTEIWQNGPVEVTYTVYEDFYSYKSGMTKVHFRAWSLV